MVSSPLTDIEELPYEQYINIDMNRLAVYGIWYLEENDIQNTFENLVVCLYRLFPNKFHLKSYEIYPDSSKILRTLMQLRPKYRNWAIKNENGGYELNINGEAILEQTKLLLTTSYDGKESRDEPIVHDDVDPILHSDVYQKYLNGKESEIQLYELYKLFHFQSHTSKHDIEKKMRDYKRISRQRNNKHLEQFIIFSSNKILHG